MEQPVVADAGPAVPREPGGDRDRQLGGVLDVDLEVVLEVLADAGELVDHGYAERLQVLGVADARELHQLGGVDRAAAEDHLAGLHRAVRPAAAQVVDTGGPLAVEADLGDHRERLDAEVGAVHHRVQVGAGGGEPAAVVDVAVEAREALLAVAVDVVGQRVAGLLGGLEERPEQRVGRRPALEDERPAAAAPGVGLAPPVDEQGLHPLEVGQAVQVVPVLHPLVAGPALVVHRVAALEDHPVDRAGPAEHLAAGVVDPAAVHLGLRLGLVLPVVEPAADRERQRGRHVDERVDAEVGATGLEHQHARRRVGGEPVGQRTAGRPAPDDDVVPVVPLPAHASPPPSVVEDRRTSADGAGAMLCQTCLVSWYSSSPATPSSRPMPDCL